MARRVHHRLEPARHPPDQLGVDPELVDQVQPADEQQHRQRKADQHQRQAEQQAEREGLGPGLPQRGRQVVVLARVMDDVRGPEPADAVAGAVDAVIGQVVEHEGSDPRPPGIADLEQAELSGPDEQRQRHPAEQRAGDRVAQPEQQRGQRVARLVAAVPAPSRAAIGDDLDHHQQDEQRDREGDRIGQVHADAALTSMSAACHERSRSGRRRARPRRSTNSAPSRRIASGGCNCARDRVRAMQAQQRAGAVRPRDQRAAPGIVDDRPRARRTRGAGLRPAAPPRRPRSARRGPAQPGDQRRRSPAPPPANRRGSPSPFRTSPLRPCRRRARPSSRAPGPVS